MEADMLIADKAFDADARVLEPLAAAGKTAVIPPRANRSSPHDYDRELYAARHLIEIYQTRGLSRFSSGARCRAGHRDDRRREPAPWYGRRANRSQHLDCCRIGVHQNELISPDANRATA
jgi:hypothetical protein